MKKILKPKSLYILLSLCFIITVIILNSCKPSALIAAKSGTQLWSENCTRCHNTPPPSIYSDAQWEAVGEHMRYKANLTDQEVKKVVAFLKSAN
jgi:hypothetical protein